MRLRTGNPGSVLPLLLIGVGLAVTLVLAACSRDESIHPHGPIADGISAPLGDPVPFATTEQLEDFAAGRAVALQRFGLSDGLGPAFNVSFCAACHERPVAGGSAGLYRNFFIAGSVLSDGSFVAAESQGEAGGVVRIYSYDVPARPPIPDEVNIVAQRNPIPFFGVGLLAEISDEEILSRADPDDDDGDGISGRANFDRGFVGRFGRKAQTVSIEGFVRGPIFNHAGITSNPLSEELRAALPVDSSSPVDQSAFAPLSAVAQAAAPDGPLIDDDGVSDPELTEDMLFDLVSFTMLLAAPDIEDPSEQAVRGAAVFDEAGCAACHTPRVESPRGPLPVYSDLLVHDMGPDLADGLVQGDAGGSEFRTQPLWGISAVGPYLHDGRAATIADAILMHGGEAQQAADRALALSETEMEDLVEFLESLGGRDQFTPGLVPAGSPIPGAGNYGAPVGELSAEAQERFLAGREAFDRDFSLSAGVGAPLFNGDSCRACHFDPVIGGAGPSDVNVMRHGSVTADGTFIAPPGGDTIIHKLTSAVGLAVEPDAATTIFEHRQTPPLFGLGLVELIPETVILANADPDDTDGDGISGRPHYLADGRLGRFGWKAQVPSLSEFVRDALGAEMGMTVEPDPAFSFGITADDDDAPDAEMSAAEIGLIEAFLAQLGPPPGHEPSSQAATGEAVFSGIGCSSCHVPALEGASGPVALYSDLLLHDILPPGTPGIADGDATMTEFRTPPLWGISDTGPYLHDGRADTIDQAIRAHAGEASTVVDAYGALDPTEIDALLAFLDSL